MAKSVQIKGVKKLNQELSQRVKLISLGSPVFGEIGNYIVRDIRRIFQQGGDPKWPESNRARKGGFVKSGKRKGEFKKGKTLQKTGRLRNSITYEVRGTDVIVGTNVKYAAIHQFGGTFTHPGGTPYLPSFFGGGFIPLRKDGKYPPGTSFTNPHSITMPARPFLVIRPNAIKTIKGKLTKAINEGKK